MAIEPFKPGKKPRHGTTAEKHCAARLGAILTPASGALPGAKADMFTDRFRIENKATIRDSHRLRLEHLCKVQDEASEQGQVPALTLQFVTGSGRLRRCGAWVCIPENVFKELTDNDD